MFAKINTNNNTKNEILINQSHIQIEKGIQLYINKIDAKKDNLIFIKNNFCGLSISITFSGFWHYQSHNYAFVILSRAGYSALNYINNDCGKIFLKQGKQIQNITINIENKILLKYLSYKIYEKLKFSQTIANKLSSNFIAITTKELLSANTTNELFIKARAYDLIAYELKMLNDSYKEPNLNKDDIKALNSAMQILKQNYKNPPTIQSLARSICINETKLKLGFKELFGMTIHASITQARMQEAKQLISQKELNLAQISKELGYKQQHNFTTAFKKYFGINPSKIKF